MTQIIGSKVLLFSSLLFAMSCNASDSQKLISENPCARNLSEIRSLLEQGIPSGSRLPETLADFDRLTTNASFFVCPATKHPHGDIKAAEEWTDYIYVQHLTVLPTRKVATVICPPENHGNEYGHVLYADGEIEQLKPDEIRQLIREPWHSATNDISPERTNELKERVIVKIPRRLESIYPSQQNNQRDFQPAPMHYSESIFRDSKVIKRVDSPVLERRKIVEINDSKISLTINAPSTNLNVPNIIQPPGVSPR